MISSISRLTQSAGGFSLSSLFGVALPGSVADDVGAGSEFVELSCGVAGVDADGVGK